LSFEKRRERERELRKKAILKAARREFFEKGFSAVTVERIAHRAELSKGTVYLYFKSKEEIYARILLNDIDIFYDRVKIIFHDSETASQTLRRFCDFYVDFFLNDRELFRIVMTFMTQGKTFNLSEKVRSDIVLATNQTINVIEKIFRAGIDRGEFSPDINLRQCRNALWGFLNGVIALHLFTGKASTIEDRIRSTVKTGSELLLEGLQKSSDIRFNRTRYSA
jgi:AcrR family transcriptional regulator